MEFVPLPILFHRKMIDGREFHMEGRGKFHYVNNYAVSLVVLISYNEDVLKHNIIVICSHYLEPSYVFESLSPNVISTIIIKYKILHLILKYFPFDFRERKPCMHYDIGSLKENFMKLLMMT